MSLFHNFQPATKNIEPNLNNHCNWIIKYTCICMHILPKFLKSTFFCPLSNYCKSLWIWRNIAEWVFFDKFTPLSFPVGKLNLKNLEPKILICVRPKSKKYVFMKLIWKWILPRSKWYEDSICTSVSLFWFFRYRCLSFEIWNKSLLIMPLHLS